MQNTVVYFPEKAINEIRFRDIVLFREKENRYRIRAPISFRASTELCGKLFKNLHLIVAVNRIDDWKTKGRTLEFYGLNPPKITLTMKSSEETKVLRIGKKLEGALEDECYARLDGRDEVFVIRSDIPDDLSHKVMEYGDHEPFAFLQKPAGEIRCRTGSGFYSLKRIKDVCLVSDGEKVWEADRNKSLRLFEILSVLDFKDIPYEMPDESFSGTQNPSIQIEAINGDGEVKTLWFGNPVDNDQMVYVQPEKGGIAFKIPSKIMTFFQEDFASLRAKTLFEGIITHLSSVRFVFHDIKSEWIFHGDQTHWTMDHPYGFLFNSGKILNVLLKFSLEKLEDGSFSSKKTEVPFFSAVFQYHDTEVPRQVIHLYREGNGEDGLHVRREPFLTVSGISDSFIKTLYDTDPFAFMDSAPFKILFDLSQRVVIEKDRKSCVFVKNSLGIWIPQEEDGRLKNEEVRALIEKCKASVCYASMEKKAGVDFGFHPPAMTFSFYNALSKPLLRLQAGSFSSEKEAFILCDDSFFIFIKNFPLDSFSDLMNREDSGIEAIPGLCPGEPERSGDND